MKATTHAIYLFVIVFLLAVIGGYASLWPDTLAIAAAAKRSQLTADAGYLNKRSGEIVRLTPPKDGSPLYVGVYIGDGKTLSGRVLSPRLAKAWLGYKIGDRVTLHLDDYSKAVCRYDWEGLRRGEVYDYNEERWVFQPGLARSVEKQLAWDFSLLDIMNPKNYVPDEDNL